MYYCPKCQSKLYPDDEKYMRYAGVCGGCVSFDTTPDKRYRAAFMAGIKAEKARKTARPARIQY